MELNRLQVVCHDCSDFRAPLMYVDYQPKRVCLECFHILSQGTSCSMPVVFRTSAKDCYYVMPFTGR